MNNIALTLGLGAACLTGCASNKTIPPELTAARAAFAHATGSEGAPLVQAQLHVAQTALEKAEKAFDSDPECPQSIDLAYVAGRSAQLAEAQGQTELALKQQGDFQKEISSTHADTAASRQKELDQAHQQLAQLKSEAKEALSQLASLKNAVKEDDRGVIITLSGAVLFPSNKADLLPAARTQLDDIASALNKVKDQKISIEGFTDATGSTKKNEDLSLHRAEAVMKYFVQKGLPKDRINAVGRGPSNPIADNKTAEGRATNRRVEIVVQGEGKAGDKAKM